MTSQPANMASSTAPLSRPQVTAPTLASRSTPGSKSPMLSLSIPGSNSSPSPAAGTRVLPRLHLTTTPHINTPELRVATPQGSTGAPQTNGRRPILPPLQPVPGGASDRSTTAVSASFAGMTISAPYGSADHSPANSSYTGEELHLPSSQSRSDADGEDVNPEDKVKRVAASKLDVEELDDEGWRFASADGRIEELGSLGEGAGGAVTKCKLKNGKTMFALKIITTDPNPAIKRQILRELEFNRRCNSPYLCKYYGAFFDEKSATISIAMEFCEGGSLDAIYREVKKLGGRTGEKPLGKIAEGVLNGLTYLHSKKIIHRDIKPSNILISRNGMVKLCDFGVSGELLGSKADADTFIGTSYYMAPERIQGLSYTITSDVWSLGVTLLEVAQHRFPFPADGKGDNSAPAGLIDLLTYIVRQPIPELKDESDLDIKWSEGFKYFIKCCLEKDTLRRASPWRMLEHPWIVEIRSKRVNMQKFLANVWNWPATPGPITSAT